MGVLKMPCLGVAPFSSTSMKAGIRKVSKRLDSRLRGNDVKVLLQRLRQPESTVSMRGANVLDINGLCVAHSRDHHESGGPEGLEKTGFPPSRE